MASAVVMDELQKRSMHTADGELGQVFAICDSQDPGTQTAHAMLAAVTRQLLLCLPEDHFMWVTVVQSFERAARKQQPPSISDIKELLIETTKVFSRIHIVMDGVDELLDRQERCDMLEQLSALVKSEVKVALLATSRSNFEDIAHAFQGAERIELEGQHGDISTYVQDRLRRDTAFLDRVRICGGQAGEYERQLIDRCSGV